MTTLLYGDKPEADVEPGNRVDTANGGPQASPPLMSPMQETTSEWRHHSHARPFALRSVVLGLAAAAAVLAGITITLIALVWSRSITPSVQVTLVVLGVFLIGGGTAYVVAGPTHTAR